MVKEEGEAEVIRFKEAFFYTSLAATIAGFLLSYHYLADAMTAEGDAAFQYSSPATSVSWRNDRLPTLHDSGNRAGLVWVNVGGKAKLRFCHSVKPNTYWATIVPPPPPMEPWIQRIIDAVEDS